MKPLLILLFLDCLLVVSGIWYIPDTSSKHVRKAAKAALKLFDDRWTGGLAQRIANIDYAEVSTDEGFLYNLKMQVGLLSCSEADFKRRKCTEEFDEVVTCYFRVYIGQSRMDRRLYSHRCFV